MQIWFPFVKSDTGSDTFTKSLAEAAEQRGHEVVMTPYAHWWQYFPWRLRFASVPAGTDVILANSWNAFAFNRSGPPVISVVHLLVLDHAFASYRSILQGAFHQTLVRWFEKRSASRASQTVAVSRYTAVQVRRIVGVENVKVILNGVDSEYFTPRHRTQSDLSRRPMRLLFVGSMSRRKGVDLLPSILGRLGAGYELSFTGGPRGDGSFAEVSGLKALGRLDRSSTREAYRSADLLLFPSRLEGLPLVVLEAMACGLPVVASNAASLGEVVEDGVHGRLCETDNVESFVTAIRELKESPDLLEEMSRSARRHIEGSFSLDRMADEYMALFEDLLDSRAIDE